MNYKIIIDFINAQDACVSEFLLLRHIEKNHPAFFEPLGFEPSLFKKHFFLFHHLYRLNGELIQDNLCLTISALEIRLCHIGDAGTALDETDALREFYLNAENLNLSDKEIKLMQQKFWQKYLALDKRSAAIKILALENFSELNRKILKQRFNQLAKVHHPDKGGDKAHFIVLKEAYEDLKLLLK